MLYSSCRHVVATRMRTSMGDLDYVGIAYVTESFPPDVNGVASTAMRVAEQLAARGHEPLVIAPKPARRLPSIRTGFPVIRVPSVGLPLYPGFRIGLPGAAVRAAIARHPAHLGHLAGPVMLGPPAGAAPREFRLPGGRVYATDKSPYARAFRLGGPGEGLSCGD